MLKYPKRTGFKLTYDAECLYTDWEEHGGCSCHTGGAPCSSCCHEGNPISLEENDEAWELDLSKFEFSSSEWETIGTLKAEGKMSRSCITDKSDPPKSQWFGYKYRVTPETSKLLQEAVFADGGGWGYECKGQVCHTNQPFLVVREKEITFSNDKHYFETCIFLPEKQPPQPTKKDFVVGKWYKCLANTYGFLEGEYHKLGKVQGNLWFEGTLNYVSSGCFDINSESDYDPSAEIVSPTTGYTAYVVFKQEATGVGKGEYGGKEYAYKCSRDDYMQWLESLGSTFKEDVLAEVPAYDKVKTVKVVRIEAKVDPIATRTLVKILPNVLVKDVEESRIAAYKPEDCVVTVGGYERSGFSLNDFSITKEDVNMSNVNRVVSVKFFDDDAGLKAEHSLVAEYQITTRVSDAMTVSKVLLIKDIAGDIDLHNDIRANTVDLHILKNTGNNVMLQPVEFEDLRVVVTNV